MGGGKDIDRENGGFLIYKYTSNETIGGVKVIERKPGMNKKHDTHPPAYSNTSEMYFGKDKKGRVEALKIYDTENHNSLLEIHTHREPGPKGYMNPEGTVHFHEYETVTINGEQKIQRKDRARKLTPDLINKYGALLEAARQRNIAKGYNDPPLNYNFVEKPIKQQPNKKP